MIFPDGGVNGGLPHFQILPEDAYIRLPEIATVANTVDVGGKYPLVASFSR